MVLSTILYGAEAWTCQEQDYAKLNVCYNKMLRYMVGKKRDEISNKDLYKKVKMDPIENIVKMYRLRWAGHVRRMKDTRLTKKVMFGKLINTRERIKTKWDTCFEKDLEHIGLSLDNWFKKAKERNQWKTLISSLTSVKKK